MKNFEVYYKNNQFIDKQSNKVLHFKPNATYTIQGDNENFLLEDYLVQQKMPLNEKLKIEKLTKTFKNFKFEKIANTGTVFYFRIGLGKMTEEERDREYLFKAVIEEDLYLKSKEGKNWNLCSCICKVTKLEEGDLGFPFAEIEADSLSELFANVVSKYFSRKRSTACNAFNTFYFEPVREKPSLNWLKDKALINLNFKRNAIMIKEKYNIPQKNTITINNTLNNNV
jgi:hypothetical protein